MQHQDFTVTLDRPRKLRLNGSSVLRFKNQTGIDIFKNPEALKDFDGVSILIWAMAVEVDPTVTLAHIRSHLSLEAILGFAATAKIDANSPTQNSRN